MIRLCNNFYLLLEQLQRKPPAQIFPLVLHGYVSAVDDTDPGHSRVMLERVLEHPLLRPHFLYLLGASKAAPWSTTKLLELAKSGEFEVSDFPVTVAVDSEGNNVHQLAPLVWREKIAREGLLAGV